MRKRTDYSQQFKEDAVSLVLSGRRVSEVARDLGINVSNLNRWRKRHLQERDKRHDGVGKSPSDLEEENRRLRKELAEQKEINTILKKTIKYVS